VSVFDWLVPFLVCPECRAPLQLTPDLTAEDGLIRHGDEGCGEVHPVIAEIPRLLRGANRQRAKGTAALYDRG
jgi:uncharacterized protein YbaR (Trm112 family)